MLIKLFVPFPGPPIKINPSRPESVNTLKVQGLLEQRIIGDKTDFSEAGAPLSQQTRQNPQNTILGGLQDRIRPEIQPDGLKNLFRLRRFPCTVQDIRGIVNAE